MAKNNLNNLSPSDLDKLLNRSFLELNFEERKNQELLESIAGRVLPVTTTAVSLREVIFNKVFFAVSVASLLTSIFLRLHTTTPPKEQKEILSINQKEQLPNATTSPSDKIISTAPEQHQVISTIIPDKKKPTQKPSQQITPVAEIDSLPTNHEAPAAVPATLPETPPLEKAKSTSATYIFPRLTEQETANNEKEKKTIARKVAKLRQEKAVGKYARIPAPADKSLGEFFMGSGEVTNLEYKTFLFDLLINERKEEFLIAKPEQDLWINAGGVNYFDALSKIYFTSEQYASFPVVNISPAGAEMYCAWLTELTNEIRKNEGKVEVDVRLPLEKEWLYAANVGHSDAVYPWFTDSIQNNMNRFYANFCIQKKAEQFRWPITYPRETDSTAYTSAGMASGNKKIATLETWSYSPNDFRLYNICGNVSEMVYEDQGKKLKTKGGNWNSDFEHLKLNSEDEFKDQLKASPMIGFRVCIVPRN